MFAISKSLARTSSFQALYENLQIGRRIKCIHRRVFLTKSCRERTFQETVRLLEQNADRLPLNSKLIRRSQCSSSDTSSTLTAERLWSQTCGCCGRNSKGDEELSDFLEKELHLRKKNLQSVFTLPTVEGFELLSANDPNVVLIKKTANEVILVKFNVNNSLEEDEVSDIILENPDATDSYSVPLVARPSFLIEISKEGHGVLGFKCNLISSEESLHSSFVEGLAPIKICELAVYGKINQWKDSVYSMSSSSLEGELHDHLLLFLYERNIDEIFMEQLLELAAFFEHQIYLLFLEEFKDFLTCRKTNLPDH